VTVTYKKFGRKYTVPAELAPETPTAQQRKVAFKKRRYFAVLKKRTEDYKAAEDKMRSVLASRGLTTTQPASATASS
jgi:hypothetical protein